jgi:hypothetical protein
MGTLTAFISTLMASTGIFMNSTLSLFCNSLIEGFGSGSGYLTSNGNDIETKRNDTSIIGVFSVSKGKKPTFPELGKIEAKRTLLLLFFAGSKK